MQVATVVGQGCRKTVHPSLRSDCSVARLAFVVHLPGEATPRAVALKVVVLGVARLEQVEKRIHPNLLSSHHHPNLAAIRATMVLNLSRTDQRHYSIVFTVEVESTIPAPVLGLVLLIVELQEV